MGIQAVFMLGQESVGIFLCGKNKEMLNISLKHLFFLILSFSLNLSLGNFI